jgi:hypothetical protein
MKNNTYKLVLFSLLLTFVLVFLSLSLGGLRHVYAQNHTNGGVVLNNTNKQMIPKFLQSLMKDISGHYSNPSFGIEDIVFPDGWHGHALVTQFGLLISMHQGNESQYLKDFQNHQTSKNVIKSIIILTVTNNSAINELHLPQFAVSEFCKQLTANSTSTLNGKSFQAYTVECPFSSLNTLMGNKTGTASSSSSISSGGTHEDLNTKGVGQFKVFEHKTTDRTFRLMLLVTNPLFTSSVSSSIPAQEKPDITKYVPLIDTTANTLKIK